MLRLISWTTDGDAMGALIQSSESANATAFFSLISFRFVS